MSSLADKLFAVADIDRPGQNALHAPTHQVVDYTRISSLGL